MTCEKWQLSTLIAEIYDASREPSLWREVLRKIAHFVGGSAATLLVESVAGTTVYDYGTDPQYRQLYLDHYIALDPVTSGEFPAGADEPITARDIFPHDVFITTRFYREWLQPQRLVDFAACVFDSLTTRAAALRVFRHERDGVVDEQARQRMRLIVPHVRRSVSVGGTIDLKTAETVTYIDMLDGISAGVFLVDAGGRIVHANLAGQMILAADDVVRAVDGRVAARDGRTDETLRGIFAAIAAGDDAIGSEGFAAPLTARSGDLYVAHVLPLNTGERRRAREVFPAIAALFVRRAALKEPSLPQAIAKIYGLTRSELRVLEAVVEIGGVADVAQALGLAASTVKTHLHHVFEKTGARRQSDLVRLVVGFTNPFAG
jgi:DNA-binding CsgD family transcriptional regulator